MYLIDNSTLQKGDVVLITWDDPTSTLVRRLSKSPYSHAMLSVGGSSVIHSGEYGVEASNIHRFLLDTPDQAAVFRCPSATRAQIEEVIRFAR